MHSLLQMAAQPLRRYDLHTDHVTSISVDFLKQH